MALSGLHQAKVHVHVLMIGLSQSNLFPATDKKLHGFFIGVKKRKLSLIFMAIKKEYSVYSIA